MKNWFKTIFHFNKTEEKGKIALLFLFWVVFVAILTKQYWWPSNLKDESNTRLYMEYVDTLVVKNNKVFDKKKSKDQTELNLKKFDPNTIDKTELLSLGLDEKAVNSIIGFRASGAVYKIKSDLKKAYGVDDKLFNEIEPFILLPDSITTKTNIKEPFKYPQKTLPTIELNKVDSATLTKFIGIGPTYASRIIKYREALGGFISTAQLYEVYAIDSFAVSEMLKHTVLDTITPKKINFNSQNFKELLAHPYMSYKQVKAVFNYREQHGNYKTYKDLYPIITLDSAWVLKISPYFSAE